MFSRPNPCYFLKFGILNVVGDGVYALINE
jgi:hypothetical protein